MKVLVTGGSGFIGSALIRHLIAETDVHVVNLDKLTYAASPAALASVEGDARYRFERADVADAASVRRIFEAHAPDAVVHLAAESHVDRSIDSPGEFIQTNVVGTFVLLQESSRHYRALPSPRRERFRVLHVSTDEVFGALALGDPAFTERSHYQPSSPYSASKAASDHLVRAWHHTFELPIVISNCSNNYGPFQFPEKLIPLMIIKALAREPLPVYGAGENVRDWLFVEDHARALFAILSQGSLGETYVVGGRSELSNMEVVRRICDLVDELAPDRRAEPRRSSITLVPDRPGHDLRYAIDCTKIETELGWKRHETFDSGLAKTVRWYLGNADWWRGILAERYRGERLGLGGGGTP